MVGGIGGDGGPGIKGVTTPLKAQESFGTKFKRFVVRVAAGIARAVFAIASPVQSLLGLIDRIAIRSRSARVGRAPADGPRAARALDPERGPRGPRRVGQKASTWKEFEASLRNPEQFQQLRSQREGLTESYDFWKAVEDWKAMPESGKLAKAKEIVDRFVEEVGKEGAPQGFDFDSIEEGPPAPEQLTANLASETAKELRRAAERDDPQELGEKLEKAQDEIFNLMWRNYTIEPSLRSD